MPSFERSWAVRRVNGRIIIPGVRDQGTFFGSCIQHAIVGDIEAAKKLANALVMRDFSERASVDELIEGFGIVDEVEEILPYAVDPGVLTEEAFEFAQKEPRIRIDSYLPLDPQCFPEDFVTLLVHILMGGTAIGTFPVGNDYTNEMEFYQGGLKKDEDEEEVPILLMSDISNVDESWDSDDVSNEEEIPNSSWSTPDVMDVDIGWSDDEVDDMEGDWNHMEEKEQQLGHAIVLVGIHMDDEDNLAWKYLDSHGPNVGDNGIRRVTLNLIKNAYILEASPDSN